MSGEEAGYLGEGEDEGQIEEELKRGDPLLAPDPGWRHTSLIGEVHRVHLLSLSRPNRHERYHLAMLWALRDFGGGPHALAGLPRIHLPRTPLNKGKKAKPS